MANSDTTLMFLLLLFVENTFKQDWGFIALRVGMPQPDLLPSGLFTHEFRFFLIIHSRQCFLKDYYSSLLAKCTQPLLS